MLIKFTANKMNEYKGSDGNGGSLHLKAGETAEVSDQVGKLLLQKYGHTFEIVLQSKPDHAPKADKMYRKGSKTKMKIEDAPAPEADPAQSSDQE